jgi:flagellar assembly factor FliW
MKIESPRLGTLMVNPSHVIEFPQGLIGLEHCRRFALFHPERKQVGHFLLQSLDDPALAFHISDPEQLGFAYKIVLADEEAAALAIRGAERNVAKSAARLAVAVILSKESPRQPVRANLNGPLVINLDTRRGLQHVFVYLENIAPASKEKP